MAGRTICVTTGAVLVARASFSAGKSMAARVDTAGALVLLRAQSAAPALPDKKINAIRQLATIAAAGSACILFVMDPLSDTRAWLGK